MIGFPKPVRLPKCKHRIWKPERETGSPVVLREVCGECGKVRLPRKPIARRTPLLRSSKPIQRGKPPRKVSKKRARQLRAYVDVRQVVLERDGECVLFKLEPKTCRALGWLPGSLEVHHVTGRTGERLNDPTKCVTVHGLCHRFAHSHLSVWRPAFLAYLESVKA